MTKLFVYYMPLIIIFFVILHLVTRHTGNRDCMRQAKDMVKAIIPT